MKINKPSNTETIVCPKCDVTSEIIRIGDIRINDTPVLLHEDVGEIYQCMNPECMEYLEKVNDEYKFISKQEIIRRQKEITDLLVAESDVARARLVPTVVEAEIVKAEAGRALSPLLFHLTADRPPIHRAYTVSEILDACKTIGFNPSDVGSRRIGFVLDWLREHKD